jgi:DNA-binding NarL/FixJ family response regulator/anti-sigma regulatory factor (Ser/Thr protein kinase)
MRQSATERSLPGSRSWTAAQRRVVINASEPAAAGVDTEDDAQSAVRAAIAAERARIVREMDYTVSKSLLGVSMIAASMASGPSLADTKGVDQRLRELAQLARRAVADARRVINDQREEALADEVRGIATAWGILTGLGVGLELLPEGQAPAEIRAEITAVLRQALRNVEQHARASRVRVSMRRLGERLLLAVADDGSGFWPPADLADLPRDGGGGLIEMNERARRLGGILIIRSRPGRGTCVELQIPTAANKQLRVVPSASPVRVIVADANPALRLGLATALESSQDIKIVAETGDGEAVAALVRQHHPDVLLLDVRMPLAVGLAAIQQISQLTQVVVLAGADDASLVMRATAAGASGCVMHRDLEQGELIEVVLDAARRRPVSVPYAPAATGGSFRNGNGRAGGSHPSGLRPREREVMGLIAEGLSNRQIAARLVISEKTVKNHICSIYQRFGVQERSQAVSRWRGL